MPRVKQVIGNQRDAFTCALNTNQVVAANLRDSRVAAGWTQDELARRMCEATGRCYSKGTISAMERSVDNGRRRVFDAHELVEFALVFDLPVTWFLTPLPEQMNQRLAMVPTRCGLNIVDFVFGSTDGRRRYRHRLKDMLAKGHRILTEAALEGHDEQLRNANAELLAAATPELVHRLRAIGTELVGVAEQWSESAKISAQ